MEVRERVVVGVVMDERKGNPGLLPVDMTPELQELVRRFPLPEGVPDADLNQAELASALNTTVNTIGKWISLPAEPMPVSEVGKNGRPYVLRLSHCYAWKRARDESETARADHARSAIEKLQATFLGIDTGDEHATLSAKQRRELADADFAWSRAAQTRRQLVRLEEIVDLVESILSTVRDGIQSMPDMLERELSLKPEEVAIVDRIGRDILTAMAERIEEAELNEKDISEVDIQNRLLV